MTIHAGGFFFNHLKFAKNAKKDKRKREKKTNALSKGNLVMINELNKNQRGKIQNLTSYNL